MQGILVCINVYGGNKRFGGHGDFHVPIVCLQLNFGEFFHKFIESFAHLLLFFFNHEAISLRRNTFGSFGV